MLYSIKQSFALMLVALALAGCVNDANYGKIVRKGAGLFLDKLTITREGMYQKDNFARCVTLHAKKSKILLSGASYSFTGPITGNHYYGPTAYGHTSDKSYQRVSDDGKKVSTYGNARWQFVGQRYLTYHLVAEDSGDKRHYVFDDVESGGINTGNRENKGAFWPLAVRGAEGKAGLQTLVDIVDKIEQCQKDLDER